MKKISLAIHGGAGTILKSEMSDTLEKKYLAGLKDALMQGYNHLKSGGSAVEAAQLAVCSLEDNSLFNAGKGSVFSSNGTHQMDVGQEAKLYMNVDEFMYFDQNNKLVSNV